VCELVSDYWSSGPDMNQRPMDTNSHSAQDYTPAP